MVRRQPARLGPTILLLLAMALSGGVAAFGQSDGQEGTTPAPSAPPAQPHTPSAQGQAPATPSPQQPAPKPEPKPASQPGADGTSQPGASNQQPSGGGQSPGAPQDGQAGTETPADGGAGASRPGSAQPSPSQPTVSGSGDTSDSQPSAGTSTTQPSTDASDTQPPDTPADEAAPQPQDGTGTQPDGSSGQEAAAGAETSATESRSSGGSGGSSRSGGGSQAESSATRQQIRQRRNQAITQSIQQLSTGDTSQMSDTQKAALVGQIAQGARVELGALREEKAQAQLTLEHVQQMAREVKRDRQTVPRQVRTGQMPSLGASNRWDALQQTNTDLQNIIDKAFSERLRLLSAIPEAEDSLKKLRSLRASSARSFDSSLQSVLKDAETYLKQRVDAMQELLNLYNQQASTATDAYDESSQYTQELSAAMVAARKRGLLARSGSGISLNTFKVLGANIADVPNLGKAAIAQYKEQARPAQTMLGFILRLAGTAVLLVALILVWAKLPAWLTAVFTEDHSAEPPPDTDGGEDLQTLREQRHAELVLPVARAALLAAIAAVGLQMWGLPQEWVMGALSVLGTWAAYFTLMAILRQLLAPRHAELRVVPIDTKAAAALYRLLRAMALWSAIMLPIIWVLSVLDYQHDDVLVLLSVVQVVGLAIIAGWMIYAAGGPAQFMEGADGRSAGSLQAVATAAVPAILGLAAAVAVLKAVGYVNLGGYLARILSLELPLVIVVLVADWQIRQHFALGGVWRKRLRALLWAALAVAQIWVLGLRWHHLQAAVDFLKRPLFTVAGNDVSTFSILRAILVIFLAWVVARLLRGWLSRSQRIRDRMSEGVQYALSSLTFYTILVAGILWAMLVGGFPLNALTVLAGMAGIGLGFGLQDIVSNFVAGLILLLERPLAVGDYIEVAGTWGRVTSVSLRSTVVRTQNNVHILVPNADLISSQLTNLSHHDRTIRLVIPVGVAYDSDIDHVIEVLVDLAKTHPDIRDFPEPSARLSEFGDSAIVVELLVWISDPEGQVGTEVDLNLDIWRTLKREGIEIPFPQQDIHLRDDSAPVRIQQLPEESANESTEE